MRGGKSNRPFPAVSGCEFLAQPDKVNLALFRGWDNQTCTTEPVRVQCRTSGPFTSAKVTLEGICHSSNIRLSPVPVHSPDIVHSAYRGPTCQVISWMV